MGKAGVAGLIAGLSVAGVAGIKRKVSELTTSIAGIGDAARRAGVAFLKTPRAPPLHSIRRLHWHGPTGMT